MGRVLAAGLALAVFLGGLGVLVAARGPSVAPHAVAEVQSGGLAAVGTAPPAQPPSEIFERVPAGRDAFEAAAAAGRSFRAGLAASATDHTPIRPIEWVEVAEDAALSGPLRVEYTLDVELTRRVFDILQRARVARGHVIALDPRDGRVLAYASTDPDGFPATRPYPAASLVKVVTAAAALEDDPEIGGGTVCRYTGNPYRLRESHLHPSRYGYAISLERALATSNNQCFAQLAVNRLGVDALLRAFARFGFVSAPAPGHLPGYAQRGSGELDLGRLGCGLAGCRITPLHAAQLAATLANGTRVQPWWIDRIADADGRELTLPYRRVPQQVISPRLAAQLREMLVRTTTRGTATSAFRDRRGRPKLGSIRVAGKTGNLSGDAPRGRYEWFVGLAPAEAPSIAVAVVQVQGHLWWQKSSQIAASVLGEVFCNERGSCNPGLARRYTERPAPPADLAVVGTH